MKNILISIFAITTLSFSNEIVVTSSINPQLEKKLSKNNFVKKIKKSSGHKFLEATISRNPNVKKVSVKEIYTQKITDEWKGAIFSTNTMLLDGTYKKEIVKLFYNKELVVKNIFTESGEALSKYLNLPIINSISTNDKEFKILKRDKKKPSPYGENMVIFSDVLSPNCKSSMPSLIKFAILYNMNIYLLNITLPAYPNSREILHFMNTAIELEEKNTLRVVVNTYKTNFPKEKTSLKKLLEIFNIANNTALTIKDLQKYNKEEKIKRSEKIARDEYIQYTPTVFVDGKRFDIARAVNHKLIKKGNIL